MKQIIYISLIITISGLLPGCSGPSKQEIIAKELAQKEKQLKYQKIRDDKAKARKLAKIKAKELKAKKREKEQARQDATVEVLGYGSTKEEALKNAFSTAVSEYIGVVVDAKEVTKNGKLIEDKILTFSNGYIDSYKTISTKEQMGLWEIKIRAIVKQQQVLSQIKKLKIEAIDIKDSENRYAKLVSQIKTKFEAEDMIVSLVKDYGEPNLYKYLDFKIDKFFIDESSATRKYVPITITYSIYFNWKKYNLIVKKFEKLFKGIGGKIIKKHSYYNSNEDHYISGTSSQGLVSESLPTASLIIIKQNQNHNLEYEVFEFPKSYKVIYPFQIGATCSQYFIDSKKVQIFKTKEVLSELLNPHLVIQDLNNKNIIKPIYLDSYLDSEEFNIFHEMHWAELGYRCYGRDGYKKVIAPPRIYETIQGGGRRIPMNSNTPLFSKTISLKFKVKDINNLKKINIK